jgi:hypothetical protein
MLRISGVGLIGPESSAITADGKDGWVSCSELNCDHCSEAVADYDRPRDPDLRAKPGEIVGEARQVVPSSGRSLPPQPPRSNVVTACDD